MYFHIVKSWKLLLLDMGIGVQIYLEIFGKTQNQRNLSKSAGYYLWNFAKNHQNCANFEFYENMKITKINNFWTFLKTIAFRICLFSVDFRWFCENLCSAEFSLCFPPKFHSQKLKWKWSQKWSFTKMIAFQILWQKSCKPAKMIDHFSGYVLYPLSPNCL